MIYRILVGSTTNVVTTLSFDDETKQLRVSSKVVAGNNPAWLTSDPSYPSTVWTGLEQADGKIVALKYDSEGKGVKVAETTADGRDPCHLTVAGDRLVYSNYSSATVGSLALTKDSAQLPSKPVLLQFKGSGPNKSRQESSHPHQVYFLKEREELLVPDLGNDAIYRLKKGQAGWSIVGHIGFEAGGGPRHTVFYNNYLYTVLELTNKVARHHFPLPPEKPKFITSKPTMSNPLPRPNDMLASEILLPLPNATFPTPYLYVSNRNDPSPEGDIISIFSIENSEDLELVAEVRTGLRHVRAIAVGGPNDKFLVAAGKEGGGVKVYERKNGGRFLEEVACERSIEAPTGLLWL